MVLHAPDDRYHRHLAYHLAILRRGYTAGGGPGLNVSGMDIK